VATELLKDAEMHVEVADNGAIALEKVQKNNYDVVLMDMQMPVMDGLTATREIRKLPGFKDLPILAMTANAMQADRERCLDAGMNDHVAKPIDPDDLWAKLLKWVKPQTNTVKKTKRLLKSTPAATFIPENIEGLNTDLGLKRVMGKKTLYLSLLRKFSDGQKLAATQITSALDSGDYTTAERIAHSLKGLAGTIGAEELQSQSAAVEAAIHLHEQRDSIDNLTESLSVTLNALVTALQNTLPEDAADEHTETNLNHKELKELCLKMSELLEAGDIEVNSFLETNQDLLQKGLGQAYAAILNAINSFDYELALSRLQKAVSTIQD